DAQAVGGQKPVLRIFELGAGMRALVEIHEHTLAAPDREDAAMTAVNGREAARLAVRDVLDPAQHTVLAAARIIAHAVSDPQCRVVYCDRFSGVPNCQMAAVASPSDASRGAHESSWMSMSASNSMA